MIAGLHVLPGALYLSGALLQLSRRRRRNNLDAHRRRGRVVIAAGVLSGTFAIVVGVVMSWGGAVEAAAAVVFGITFVVELVLAYRAVRSGDVAAHRRWMLRAFALGVAVGTIRLIVGLLEGLDLLPFDESFGLAFWLAFVVHAAVAEGYLRITARATRGELARAGTLS